MAFMEISKEQKLNYDFLKLIFGGLSLIGLIISIITFYLAANKNGTIEPFELINFGFIFIFAFSCFCFILLEEEKNG